jgi:hypothetical protein
MENEKNKLGEQTKNFISSMVTWGKDDKFKTVSSEVFDLRKSICEACEHWNKNGFSGMGRCKKCGCSVGKLYVPSAKCPDNPPRWDKVNVS